MNQRPTTTFVRGGLLFAGAAILVTACGGDDQTGESRATSVSPPDETTSVPSTTSISSDSDATASGVSLADVCPNPLVIQLDWFPQAEYGALFNLVGEGYEIDTSKQVIRGPLVTGEEATDIDIELRSGGPAIGNVSPRSQAYTDDSIHLAQSNLEAQIIQWDDLPLVAVAAPLEINPQIIMWDGTEHPNIETIADLGEQDVTINTSGTGGYIEIFTSEGIWSEEQVDPSYDGTPIRFIADRTIAQQGFASAEPYKYEFEFEEYGKPVEYQLLHDAGFQTYSQTLSVRLDRLEELSSCLERFVPIVQRSVIDFAADPMSTIETIVDMVDQVDAEWTQSVDLGHYAVETMTELGLHGNGNDETVANFDEARIDKLLAQIRDAGVDINADLTTADLIDESFIDPTIGFES